jgi:hypothetical protein
MARIRYRLLCGTWETIATMLRKRFKLKPHKNLSTKELHRDGLACSSDEVSVKKMKRGAKLLSLR